MITEISNILSIIFIFTGLFFCGTGLLGLYKMPDIFMKQHATGLIDTAGYIFILLGIIFYYGITLLTLKIVILALFAKFISASSSNIFLKSFSIYEEGIKNLEDKSS